jgi:hypothetical protein
LVGVEVFGREGDESGGAVVGEEDEDLVLGGGGEDLLALGGGGVAFEGGEEVLGGDVCALVVDLDAGVDVDACVGVGGLVEDLALVGVGGGVGDVVVGEGDDVLLVESVLGERLVGVVDVGLVPVVAVGV